LHHVPFGLASIDLYVVVLNDRYRAQRNSAYRPQTMASGGFAPFEIALTKCRCSLVDVGERNSDYAPISGS
jgi:hypothetical protein